MSMLNMSLASTCSRLIALLLLLIACISTRNVNGLVNYPYDNNDGELKNLVMPASLFSYKGINTRAEPSSIGSDYDLQYGQVHIIPFKKRTIPIELQKALYAHGIVGRRR